MALQGTIDTFDLTEVIRMLALGEKTGRLGLSGDRGSGSLWFVDGCIVASDTDSADFSHDHASVLFQLLRFETGSFIFDQGAESAKPESPVDSEPVIDEAVRRLDEWHQIAAVVPSLDHRVVLERELSRSDIVLDKVRWRAVAAVGDGSSVGDLGRELNQDELDVSRTVKDLHEMGLVDIGDPADSSENDEMAEPVDAGESTETLEPMADVASEPSDDVGEPPADPVELDAIPGVEGTAGFVDDITIDVVDESVDGLDWPAEDQAPSSGARDQLDALASGFGLNDEPFVTPAQEPVASVGFDEPATFGDPEPLAGAAVAHPGSFPIEEAEAAGEATTPLFAHDAGPGAVSVDAAPAPGEAAEVARQLANLSPEAAREVAAAARATTDEEREAALAQVAEDGDEPLDPDLLRSFLASVKH